MEKVLGWIVVVAIIVGLGWLVWHGRSAPADQQSRGGQVVVSFSDPAASMQGISEVTLGVGKVEVYSQSKGWVSLSSAPSSFGLLGLDASGKSQLYAAATVPADTYTRVRATWTGATVVTSDGASHDAVMPSYQMEATTTLRVVDGQTSAVGFQVHASDSLFSTEDGGYVFAPVVDVESRSNATANVGSDGTVSVVGGSVDSSADLGTDLNGTVSPNLRVNADVKINLQDGKIELPGGATSHTLLEMKG